MNIILSKKDGELFAILEKIDNIIKPCSTFNGQIKNMNNLDLNVPTPPKPNKFANPDEFAKYKVDCLRYVMDFLQPYKDYGTDEQMIKNANYVKNVLANCDFFPEMFHYKNVHNHFPLWVFIAIHLKNPHTLKYTGSKNGHISIFLAKCVQLEILREVVVGYIETWGKDSISQMLFEDYQITDIPFEAFYYNTTLLAHEVRHELWHWFCLILSYCDETNIIKIINQIVSTKFTSRQNVAHYLCTGELDYFSTLLDQYFTCLDRTYLVSMGIKTHTVVTTDPETGEKIYQEVPIDTKNNPIIAKIAEEIDKWPS